jgi:thiol-disulfide isomerase/thioredoxin
MGRGRNYELLVYIYPNNKPSMKKYFPILFSLLLVTTVEAQKLTLKPGQKFSYELVSENKFPGNKGTVYHTVYTAIDFEVVTHIQEKYDIKVWVRRKISYHDQGGEKYESLSDSKDKPSRYTSDIYVIADYVLSQTPFFMTLDETGNVVEIKSDPLKAAVLKETGNFSIPSYMNAGALIDNYFDKKYFFKYETVHLFKAGYQGMIPDRQRDTTYSCQGRQVSFTVNNKHVRDSIVTTTSDTVHVRESFVRNGKYGLKEQYQKDSLVNGIYIKDKSPHSTTLTKKVVLVASNAQSLVTGRSLLPEFKDRITYDHYFSSGRSGLRELSDLQTYYLNNKGQQGLAKELLGQIDSLDRLVAKNDYPYMAAKAGLLSFLDYDKYKELIKLIPVEYFTRDHDVINKLQGFYRDHQYAEYVRALQLLFEKFRTAGKYPPNVHILASFIDTDIADTILQTDQAATLQTILNTIGEVEKLNIQELSALYAGVKNWAKAKSAINKDELERIAQENFNSRYDNAGRYRLLIYTILKKKAVADSITSAYLDLTIGLLENNLTRLDSIGENEDMMWQVNAPENKVALKKYIADAYYLKSQENKTQPLKYLQVAADIVSSPGDRNYSFMIEHENHYFASANYPEIYMEKVKLSGDTSEDILSRYVDMVILQPQRYPVLQQLFAKKYPSGDFSAFFSQALQKKLPESPAFVLNDLSGTKVISKDNPGKWLFIDFWGTWCRACTGEIDKIEDMYKNNPSAERLKVTTIACYDKKEWVSQFMSAKSYSFPVLMSDGNVENLFNVKSYPTKILILPNGHYLIIPSREDYKSLLQQYLMWGI